MYEVFFFGNKIVVVVVVHLHSPLHALHALDYDDEDDDDDVYTFSKKYIDVVDVNVVNTLKT